jgi:hypothetical protein
MLSFLRNIESRYASSSHPAVSGRRGLYATVASSSRPSQAASSTPTTSAQTKCHATAPPPFPSKDAYYLHLLRASSTPRHLAAVHAHIARAPVPVALPP